MCMILIYNTYIHNVCALCCTIEEAEGLRAPPRVSYIIMAIMFIINSLGVYVYVYCVYIYIYIYIYTYRYTHILHIAIIIIIYSMVNTNSFVLLC